MRDGLKGQSPTPSPSPDQSEHANYTLGHKPCVNQHWPLPLTAWKDPTGQPHHGAGAPRMGGQLAPFLCSSAGTSSHGLGGPGRGDDETGMATHGTIVTRLNSSPRTCSFRRHIRTDRKWERNCGRDGNSAIWLQQLVPRLRGGRSHW